MLQGCLSESLWIGNLKEKYNMKQALFDLETDETMKNNLF